MRHNYIFHHDTPGRPGVDHALYRGSTSPHVKSYFYQNNHGETTNITLLYSVYYIHKLLTFYFRRRTQLCSYFQPNVYYMVCVFTVKRLAIFPSLAGMSLTNLFLVGNNLIIVTSRQGTGKSLTFFTVYRLD